MQIHPIFPFFIMQPFIGSSAANSCAKGNTESAWNIHNCTEAASEVVPIASELQPQTNSLLSVQFIARKYLPSKGYGFYGSVYLLIAATLKVCL